MCIWIAHHATITTTTIVVIMIIIIGKQPHRIQCSTHTAASKETIHIPNTYHAYSFLSNIFPSPLALFHSNQNNNNNNHRHNNERMRCKHHTMRHHHQHQHHHHDCRRCRSRLTQPAHASGASSSKQSTIVITANTKPQTEKCVLNLLPFIIKRFHIHAGIRHIAICQTQYIILTTAREMYEYIYNVCRLQTTEPYGLFICVY